MRQDEQVNACLTFKKFLIINDWEIQTQNEEIKKFIEYNLKYLLPEIFEKKLFNILSALDYGFSLTEKIFGYENTEFGKKIILKDLKTRTPHSLEFHQDNYGNLDKIIQDTKSGKIELNKYKYIIYAYQKEFDNFYGKSEFNIGTYRAWFSKNAIIKFWNIYLERFGMPVIKGKYPLNRLNEKEEFLRILKNVQSKTAITYPDGFDIDLLEVSKTSESGFEKAIDKYNLMIARNMLMPDLMGISGGQTGGGSYSLGQEQFGIFYKIINQIKNEIAILIDKEIIKPLVLWNFGKQEEDVYFSWIKTDDGKKDSQVKNWLEAIKTGKLDPSWQQWNYFLQSIQFPELTKEEIKQREEETKAKADMKIKMIENNPLTNQNNNTDDDTNNDNENEAKQDIEKEKTNDIKNQTAKYGKYYRELTQYEKKINYTRLDKTQTELWEKYKIELADLFKTSINALVDEIKRKGIIEKKRIDLVNKLELKFMSKIQQSFNNCLKESYKFGKETAKEEMPNKSYIVDSAVELDNEDVINWLKQNAIFTTTTEAEEILKKVKPILYDSIRNGAGVKETISMINDALKSWDITMDANRIETIVRTVTQKAFNEARGQQFNEVKDMIVGYQYSAIMDDRTSDICAALDGKIFNPTEFSYYNPPKHYNCRSLLVPIYADEKLDGFSEMPATERIQGDFLKLV